MKLTPYSIGWCSPWSAKLTNDEKRELTQAVIDILRQPKGGPRPLPTEDGEYGITLRGDQRCIAKLEGGQWSLIDGTGWSEPLQPGELPTAARRLQRVGPGRWRHLE